MFKITRFFYVFLNLILVACAAASPAVPAFTATPLLTQILNPTQTPAGTLVALPDKNLGRFSTVLGVLEFTTLRLPDNAELTSVTSTPYGLVAIFDSTEVRWSTDGETWQGFIPRDKAWFLTTAGEDIFVWHERDHLTRYAWRGDGFYEVTRLENFVRQIVLGPHGAVAISDNIILYSSDGIHFSKARRGPYEGIVPAHTESSIDDDSFEGGCQPNRSVWESEPHNKIGKVLATDGGFVALTPAHSDDWDKKPICEPLLWFSVDGNDWELVSDQSPFGNHAYVKDIAEWNGRFIAIGGSVWVSDDGLTWDRVEIDLLGVPETIAAGVMGWVLIDGNNPAGNMWFSTNGMIWDGPYDFPDKRPCGYLPLVLAVGTDAIFGGCVGKTPMLAHH
ncbi:MAG: hypothetical protein ACM3PY_12850 [Omnitrophica WOR_2 bacterium]